MTVALAARPRAGLSAALVTVVIVPQLGMSMITPGLAAMAAEFGVSTGAAQFTVVAFMAGYALSMLLTGVLADRFDPARVQIWGLGLFVLASVVCVLAPSLPVLVAARFVQAAGGCAGTVVARLIVRREAPEADHMRLLTTLAAAIAVTPSLSPLLGVAVLGVTGWRGVFATTAILGVLAAVVFALICPRGGTPPPPTAPVLRVYRSNLADPGFRYYAAAISLAWMAYFVFTSCAPQPLQSGLRVSPLHYGLISAAAAIGYVTGSVTARRLAGRAGIDRLLGLAAAVCCAGGLLTAGWTLLAPAEPWALAGPMILVLVGVGAAIPACQAGLLKVVRENPGNASGLFFFLQMISGAAYAAAANLRPPTGIAAVGLLVAAPAVLLLALTLRRRRTMA